MGVVVTKIASLSLAVSTANAASVCSSDPGAAVCYDFESGTLNGWYLGGDCCRMVNTV
jgi:hypothetical protein